jgi:hypothetical protein
VLTKPAPALSLANPTEAITYEPGASAAANPATMPPASSAGTKCSTQARMTQAGADRSNPAPRIPG